MDYADILKIVATVLGSVTSAGAVILALSGWLGRVWAARILENDRAKYSQLLEQLKVEGQKRILVHRVQFETEFQAYREVWEAVATLILHVLELRPIIEFGVDPSVPEAERRQLKLQRCSAAATAFLDTARRFHPFLAPSVDEEMNKLFRLVQKEQLEFQYGREDGVGFEKYWATQKENSEAIQAHAKSVAAAMQRRIGLLEVPSE